MLCKQTLFLIATSLAAVVSLPSPSPDMELKVIRQHVVGERNFTLYGDMSLARRDTVDLNRRCGTNVWACDSSNTASWYMCSALILYLKDGLEYDKSIASSPRSACLYGQGQILEQCCISWADPISGAEIQDLDKSSKIVLDNCHYERFADKLVSGLIRDTLIGSTCTTVCMSNRPDRCR